MSSIFSHLNPTPSFPAYCGPHAVGTSDYELPVSSLPQTVQKPPNAPSTIAFRLYYPSQPPTSHHTSKPVRWISKPQHEQLASVWRFLGLGHSVSSWLTYALPHLSWVSIPARRDAPIATPDHEGQTRWPVMVFSHGLGGSRNAYSYLCGCLASHGIIVAAPDHRDGSQPISFVRSTEEEESRRVQYRVMKHTPCDDTFRGRDEQLRIRIWEISMLMEALSQVEKGAEKVHDLHKNTEGATGILSQLKNRLDLGPGSVTFAGHSFGATTTMQLMKSVFYRHTRNIVSSLYTPIAREPAISSNITARTPAILLDPWALPITNPDQAQLKALPMPNWPYPDTAPMLTIMSTAFYNWKSNRNAVLEAVSAPTSFPEQWCKVNQPHVFYPSQSAHLSQSDFGMLFPRLTKYLAKAGEPGKLIELNVWAILETIRSSSRYVEPFDVERVGEKREDDEGWVDLADEDKGDARILSHEKDAVKGWNFVSVEDRLDPKPQVDGTNDDTHAAGGQNEEHAAGMGNAEAFVVHGRKRSEPKDERADSGTEENVDGIIDSGKA